MRQAVLWGVIPRNPLDAVEPPRSTHRRPDLWTVEQTRTFVASLDGETWHGTVAALMLGGSLRLGEALGLRWEDVDLDGGAVTVGRTRTLIRRQFVEGEPKTAAGNRVVTLPAFALPVLRRWRRVQAVQRLGTGPAWTGDARVVTLPDGATPSRTQASYRLAVRAKELGLPALRNHDLRHLSASLALAAGITLPDVSRRLGHANVSITATIYAHALEKNDAHVADAIGRAVGL
jgi:integrase